jgi:hypothetical protein
LIPTSKSFQRSIALIACLIFLTATHPAIIADLNITQTSKPQEGNSEYLWYEAENMRGFTTGKLGEPIVNPSYLDLPKEKSPGWGMNGPGVSAEWTQGGESEWNSAAASANETNASIYQDLEIPRSGKYKFWVRYADWANKNENFSVTISQNGQRVFQHEFGTKDIIDPHDEVSMYWGWSFTWDGADADTSLGKGPARVSIEIRKPAEARRNVDCYVLTNDLSYVPSNREKPDFAAMRYLRQWSSSRIPLASIVQNNSEAIPDVWLRPKVANRDFMMPWNIAREFWAFYDQPEEQRPIYPFNAETIGQFVERYKGVKEVPLFDSKFVVPVIYLNHVPELFQEGSAFVRYLRLTKSPFAILINYASAKMNPEEGQAVWKLLNGEFKDQFLGWISGESVGYVWDYAPAELKLSGSMSRRELLEAHRVFYTNALARKWQELFHLETGPQWDKLIPAQSTSSTSFAHALSEWGVRLLGMETAAVMPMTGMRIAFTRGAARQFGGSFLYYHAPNFGDTATSFTKAMNYAGPDYFYHTRYGASMGPSLSWYRKSYYLYYMSGASAIYLEQGNDQFFKPGPGEHPFQLNPLGRITNEFMQFAEKHPDRGTPYTPVAFLLDPAHGFEMTDYPQWPFEVSQIDKSDRALRELFGVAYFPGPVVEGEPALADRQPFINSIFGDIFDVLTASGSKTRVETVLNSYRAVVVGGRIEWNQDWTNLLQDYVRKGGTLVLNSAQVRGLPESFLGVHFTNQTDESDNAKCLSPGELVQDLSGQMFRYDKVEVKTATSLITTSNGDPLVTIQRVGKGNIVLCTVADLLGEDERMTPFAAHMLSHVFSNVSPIKVEGDVEHLINAGPSGWVVTLINNTGVFKEQQGMARVDRRAYVDVSLNLRDQKIVAANDWVSNATLAVTPMNQGSSVRLRLAPGGIAVVALRTK